MQTALQQSSAKKYFELCVLMPCYNNVSGLVSSLKSIVYDPLKFTVLIVDDGSSVSLTLDSLRSHLSPHINIHILRLEINQGITRALNEGLDYIYNNFSVSFIARLDCGDICDPQRFNKQIAFLKSNPDIDLLGSWCYFKNLTTGEGYQYITPTMHKQIERTMHFRNVFIHPTVVWRCSGKNQLQYPEQYPHAEDYGLFYAMISSKKSAIMNEFLVTCEINHAGISIQNRTIQLKSRLKVVSVYGKSKLFSLMGALKINLLMIIPYQYILNTKKIIFKAT